jgi:Kef-type K+ transport system membrane component KefB
MESTPFLSALIIVWIAAKVAGEGLQRLGQTAVLGELLAGIIIGPGVLGLVPIAERLNGLAEIGIVILLFEIGLESDLDELLRSGAQAILVALVGVMSPLLLGFALARAWGLGALESVLVASALTATSVGITARVLADLGRVQDPAGRVVLSAAVVDDVLGLVLLAVVMGLVRTGGVSVASISLLLIKAALFLVIAIGLGVRLASTFIRWVGHMQARGSLIVSAVLFCTLFAVLAERVGLAALIGAFAAGLILAKTERRNRIEEQIKPIADLFVPIFFATTGMKVELATLHPLAPRGALVFAVLLTLVAILSKLTAALAVYQPNVRRWCVGVGLIPRGEVGLVFAGIGFATTVIDSDIYAAIVVMIILTTFIAPLWLKTLYRGLLPDRP